MILTSKKFWLPILLAFAAYIGVYVAVFMPIGPSPTTFSTPVCCYYIIFAPAHALAIMFAYMYLPLSELVSGLIQFLGYGIVIGIAWHKNQIKRFLILLIIVHVISVVVVISGFIWFFSRL